MAFPMSVSSFPTAFVLICDTAPLRSMRETLDQKISSLTPALELRESGVLQAVRRRG